jgi:hypothetical protein
VRRVAQEIAMKTGLAKSALSESRQRLVELFQRINFGRIEYLEIRDGQPVLTPPPCVIREHKFCGENSPRPELASNNFVLKAQLVDLFKLFDELRNGTIAVLTIKHGLPFHAELPV